MKTLCRASLSILFLVGLPIAGLGQSAIITTYAGPPLPTDGTLATTQAIDAPTSVVADGTGGFYLCSSGASGRGFNRIYHVTGSGTLTLVAGNGSSGFGGEGGPATSAPLGNPRGISLDTAGNLFVADTGNNRIRKISPGGIITTVAGNGNAGFGGDSGQALLATLSGPTSVVIDPSGNLYIADAGNFRVRKVTPAGIISTIVGTGTTGFGGDGGPGTAATISAVSALALDLANNLYVADSGNSRIRRVNTLGSISTYVGFGTTGYGGDGSLAIQAFINDPSSLSFDGAGNLFFTDTGNFRVRKVTTGGNITTVTGNGIDGFSGDAGIAVLAKISTATGVASDSAGNLFIADTGNSRVRFVTNTGSISSVAGNGTQGYGGDGGAATSASFSTISSIAVDAVGNLFIADTGNNVIRRVTPLGIITTFAGNGTAGYSGDGGPAAAASLSSPRAVAVDTLGNLYIADSGNARVRKVTTLGIISTVAGNGSAGFTGDGAPAIGAALSNQILGLAVDAGGNIWISDSGNVRIRLVNNGGVISTAVGTGVTGYTGDGGQALNATLNVPWGIALDASGSLYIADSGNMVIRKVTSGIITTIAGSGNIGFDGDGGSATNAKMNSPRGVVVDAAGNLYIADTGNQRIRKVTTTGSISTFSGNGSTGFSGDGGLATLAPLNFPGGVTIDSAGSLFISDDSGRIRRVGTPIPFHVGSFAQLASGGGWKTTLTLVNIASGTVTARVNLYADNGSALTLPLTVAGVTVTNSFVDVTIPAQGTAVVETEALTPTLVRGWADVQASVPGSLVGFGIFRARTAGLPDLEGTSPLDIEGVTALTLPYDNTSGFLTGIAIAVRGPASTINVRLRDQNGLVLANSQISLPTFGHTAFFISDLLSQSANKRGTVELDTPSGTITALGLRFNPTSSFTSVPVLR